MNAFVHSLIKKTAAAMERLVKPGSWFALQNTQIELQTVCVANTALPAVFDGYRILHVSDLHNTMFGADHCDIVCKMQESDPDIIVVTGDVVDAEKTNMDIAADFLKKAAAIAPVYFVSGNHEARIGEQYNILKEKIAAHGIPILDDACIKITKEDASFDLLGLADPMFYGEDNAVLQTRLQNLKSQCAGFTVLLSHRPELFELYVQSGVDLVFSGHAHGGQFVVPGLGGLFAPHQGFFPKYAAGTHQKGGTTMVISRGLGNSTIPIRLNNHPELISVQLHR